MIKDVIKKLKSTGCSASWQGDRLVIENIPSWRFFKLIQDWQFELAAVGFATNLFQTPHDTKPIKVDKKGCNCCANLDQYQCPYQGNKGVISASVFAKGCERWRKNSYIYF